MNRRAICRPTELTSQPHPPPSSSRFSAAAIHVETVIESHSAARWALFARENVIADDVRIYSILVLMVVANWQPRPTPGALKKRVLIHEDHRPPIDPQVI
jgi:hypothetical protein